MLDVSDDVDVFCEVILHIVQVTGKDTLMLQMFLCWLVFQDGNGYVIFSSFHFQAQNNNVVDTTILTMIEGLNPGPSYEKLNMCGFGYDNLYVFVT